MLDDLKGAITAIAPISGVIAAERKVPNGVRDAPRSCSSLSRSNFPCILAVFPGYAPSRFSRPLRSSPTSSKTGLRPVRELRHNVPHLARLSALRFPQPRPGHRLVDVIAGELLKLLIGEAVMRQAETLELVVAQALPAPPAASQNPRAARSGPAGWAWAMARSAHCTKTEKRRTSRRP